MALGTGRPGRLLVAQGFSPEILKSVRAQWLGIRNSRNNVPLSGIIRTESDRPKRLSMAVHGQL